VRFVPPGKTGSKKMKRRIGMQALSLLLVCALVGTAFVPAVSAFKSNEESASIQQLAGLSGINLKHFDSKDLKFEKVGQRTYFSSTISYEAEAEVDSTLKQVKGTDQVQGYFNDDGTYHVTSSGQNGDVIVDLCIISESDHSKTYQYSREVTKDGKTSRSESIQVMPKSAVPSAAFSEYMLLGSDGKTKVDLPSMAPSGAIKVLDDVRASDVKYGSAILGVIAGLLGQIEIAAVLELAAIALDMIEDYGEVDLKDVYLDFFLITTGSYAEVDYFYY
jgi:hypothetical protein